MAAKKEKRNSRPSRPAAGFERALEPVDGMLDRVSAIGKPSKRKHPTLADRKRAELAARGKPVPAPPGPDEAMRQHAAMLSTDLHHEGMPTLAERVRAEGFKAQLRGRRFGVPAQPRKADTDQE